MAAWMIYVVVVSAALSVAAWLAEQAARQRRTSSRWLWVLALVASLLLPTIVSSVSIQMPDMFRSALPQKPIVLRDAATMRLPSAITDWVVPEWTVASPHRPVLLPYLWGATSAGILIVLVLGAGLLYRRRRGWTNAILGGTSVFVAPDIGPAVVGLLRPRIVVPAWLLQASVAQQEFVLAHEQAHLDALDPQVQAMAWCLLLAMPWNLPLWWQLHRLRRAIEVDCDARVVRHGQRDVAAYGEALIEAGQHRSAHIGAMTAMSESSSFLEQRIRILLLKPAKWARLVSLVLACMSVEIVAVAAQVSPPDAQNTGAIAEQHVKVPRSVLESYVGTYQFGPSLLITVTLNGMQLAAQMTDQDALEIFPSSETEFFYKVVDARVSFVRDAQGRVTTFILHQNGRDMVAARIDAAVAAQISAFVATRVKNQQPFPGSEAALRRLLDDGDDPRGMSPQLAQIRHTQYQRRLESLAPLGSVISFEFIGVAPNGWDKYLVRRQHGTEQVDFVLDGDGIITGAIYGL